MKTRFVITLLTLSSAILWFTVALQGQMAPRPLLKVDVPFKFVAGGMNLPAGQYDVLHIMNPGTLLLRNRNGHGSAVVRVLVSPTTPGDSSARLVFNRYGEKYFLSQVWTEQDNEVHDCFKSSAELTLARSSRKLPEVATVYARP
jgi:hypothetical protein